MNGNSAQPHGGGFDWYDFWKLVNIVGTGLSLGALVTGGKEAKQLGQLGTVLGIGSHLAQQASTPPQCGWCGRRMSHPPQRYPGGPQWVCICAHAT